MSKAIFNLPASSLSELEKIVDGYFVLEKDVSLDDISGITGIARTTLSPNHPFLKEVGIVEGATRKRVTPVGKELGGAIHHKQYNETRVLWKRVVDNNDFLSKVASTVRIKKEMLPTDFASHILYVAKAQDNKSNRTGANAIVDILIKSGILREVDGKLEYVDSPISTRSKDEVALPENQKDSHALEVTQTEVQPSDIPKKVFFPDLHIDIQIHISSETSPEQIDQVFASMAKHFSKLGKLKND